MNSQDQERVNESFSKGVEVFTEDDLEKVRKDSAAAEEKSAKLGEQFESFKLTWGLLQDYWAGNYKNVPWKLLASIGFAVTYLVSPLDIIPDFLPVLGFVDDAAVFALVVSSFQSELDAYKEWKNNQPK
ncbi:MAG: DUF1232 domain-containing protein [Lentisphaeria bacterium]|nr:DUF1232 domain-containing protein [Lentisphaeria bacterium]